MCDLDPHCLLMPRSRHGTGLDPFDLLTPKSNAHYDPRQLASRHQRCAESVGNDRSMLGVEERVMGSRLQSSGCTISTTVASLILWPISSQLPDGTGALGKQRELSVCGPGLQMKNRRGYVSCLLISDLPMGGGATRGDCDGTQRDERPYRARIEIAVNTCKINSSIWKARIELPAVDDKKRLYRIGSL
jgi:hypothetical protein